MSSIIFAICCHILFYSRSASALRVAEVDDYLKAKPDCNNEKAGLFKGIKYVCKKVCPGSLVGTQVDKSGKKDDEECAGLIKGSILLVTASTGGGGKFVCTTYTSIGKQTCKGADKVPAYALSGTVLGDPHVINMAGEKFDILTSGTFSLLSLTRATEEDLAINGTVVRFGTKCGQSFIDDLQLTGGWIREFYNTKTLKVRAVQDTPQNEAIQVNFGQKWQPLADLQEMARIKKTADAIQLDLSKLTIEVGAGKHRHHGWNFLNLDVQGLATLGDNIRIGGLLGYDDHKQVSEADADCAMFASTAETDTQDQQSCLSYLKAN